MPSRKTTPPGAGNRWSPGQKAKTWSGRTETHVGSIFARVTTRYNNMHDAMDDIMLESIQVGSPITGAPGQPVDEFVLLPSYHVEKMGPRTSRIVSYEPYSWGIENAVGPHGPIKLRSSVGGFHSIKRTVAANDRVAAAALRRLNGGS